ncbi:MAG: HAMP domain-containing histidine kinase [Acidobacteria bacterium]|nr:HAMP domain-containing histidine kinase [Acidobacteriota bacterium]
MNRIFDRLGLRTKISLLYAVLLIFSVVPVSYYSYWNIWQLFIENEAGHVRAEAKPVIAHWLAGDGLQNRRSAPPAEVPVRKALALARDLTSRNTAALVLDSSGHVIARGKRLAEEPDAPAPNPDYVSKALSGNNEITYWNKENGILYLTCLIPLRPEPDSPRVLGVIQVSRPLSGIRKILFRYGYMQMAAVMIVLILGILFGYWLIGLSLKDLRSLSLACREIERGNFNLKPDVRNRKDEIGNLADSFELMTNRLGEMFGSRKRFVTNAAHELLTPLTGLRGSLEVLLRDAVDEPETVNRLAKGMFREVNHLIRLCDRLLGISRVENAADVEKDAVELKSFFRRFQEQSGLFAPEIPVRIQEGPPVTVMADADMLEQILLNLLSNVLSHCPPETSVVSGWRLVPGFVEIWFSDTGGGMDAETLSRAFEPFYRKGNRGAAGGRGTGLGLTLIKSMVDAQGGNVRIESSQGDGTTVFFTLPL